MDWIPDLVIDVAGLTALVATVLAVRATVIDMKHGRQKKGGDGGKRAV